MGDQTREITFEDAVQLIKERADLVGMVSKHTKLTKAARGFKACCPFHKEKTPSFYININGNYFYCYGCQKGGSVFDFLQYSEGLSFSDALKELAAQLRIDLPKSKQSKNESDAKKIERETGLDLLSRVATFYHRVLCDSPTVGAKNALEYLKTRGISLAEITELGLGWAPEAADALVKKITKSSERELAQKLDLLRSSDGRDYDSFRARLMIPIKDSKGRVVGFSGRTLDAGNPKIPKYKNSSESEWFKKKELLYGLDSATKLIRSEGFVCVVEGYFDQWAFLRRSIPAVAVMGTALTQEHLYLLARHTKEVVLILDADAAGIAATKKSLPLLLDGGFSVKVYSGLDAKDPDEWLKENFESQEQIKIKLLSSPSALEWWMRLVLSESNTRGSDRVDALKRLTDLWLMAKSAAERNVLADEVARILGMESKDVKESLDAFIKSMARPLIKQQSTAVDDSHKSIVRSSAIPPRPLNVIDKHTRELLVWWVDHWDLLNPKSQQEWEKREKLFEGTFAESFVKSLAILRPQNKDSLVPFADEASTLPILKNTLLRALVPEERGSLINEGLGEDKILNSFNQLSEGLRHEKAIAEMRQIQNKIRATTHDPSETTRLLKRAQELMDPSHFSIEKK